MGIVVVVLSALFLALGAVPPVASSMATARVRERLQAPATVHLQVVPTWRLLTGEVDRLQLAVGPMTVADLPIKGLSVQGGPCALDAPCRLQADLSLATRDLEPMIQTTVASYTADLAENLGVPGAEVVDLTVTLAATSAVSGRFQAFGGLLEVPFRIEGRLGRLDDQTVGLIGAKAMIHDRRHDLDDIPVWTLPPSPLEGLQVGLRQLTIGAGQVRATLQVDVARPRALLQAAPPTAPSP